MIIYRAMSEQEAAATEHDGTLQWQGKHKWFSPSYDHVQQRVQDGQFNNAKWKPERYKIVLAFFVERGVECFHTVGRNELMLNVRDVPKTRISLLGRVIEVKPSNT